MGRCIPNRVHAQHRILGGTIIINGATSHPSHQLQFVNAHYVCMACGHKASQPLYNLKGECKPRARTSYGDTVLRAVQEGTL